MKLKKILEFSYSFFYSLVVNPAEISVSNFGQKQIGAESAMHYGKLQVWKKMKK